MELLDKYLQNVRSYLPPKQRDDIVKELEDDILSQLEDKEAELGRSLTAAEQEAIIKLHGDPIEVVARYQLDTRSVAFGRQLIGPVLYPFYIKVLTITMGISLLAHIVTGLALYYAGESVSFDGVGSSTLVHMVIQFGIITLIFSLAQANATRNPEGWDTVALAFESGELPGKTTNQRIEALAEFVVLWIAFFWLLNVDASQTIKLGDTAAEIALAPIWQTLYVPILLLTFAGIVQSAIVMLRPALTRFRLLTNIAMDLAGVVVVAVLLTAGEWIVLANPGAAPAEVGRLVDAINDITFWALISTAIVCLVMALFDGYKLLRLQQRFTPQRA